MRSWLYRIRPSVQHTTFIPANCSGDQDNEGISDIASFVVDPNQFRWSPTPFKAKNNKEYVPLHLFSLDSS